MTAILRAGKFRILFLAALPCWCLPDLTFADNTYTLKNGMILEGSPGTISSVAADPLKGSGPTDLKLILIIDDQLRRVFVPTKQVVGEIGRPAAVGMVKIPLFQKVANQGQTISAVGMPLRMDPFDEWGRRTYSMVGPRGKAIDVVQGITEITPRWTKVEAIQGINHYIWTMKIATSSIPREQLSKILARALDDKDPEQRLRIVRLYMQAERFPDARAELEQFVKDFPNRANYEDTLKQLRRLGAELLLKEIDLRIDAGQFRLAVDMLTNFPSEEVPGETLLKVRENLDEIKSFQTLGHQALKLIDTNVAAFKGDATREDVKGIVAEIKSELNVNTLDRFADFLRLADDASMSPEQKVSLAISGWLMGSGAAIDNLGVATSLVQVRELVRQYLLTTRAPERKDILARLDSLEGATPAYIAAIIAHMKPPLEPSLAMAHGADVGNAAAVLGLPGATTKAPAAAPIPPKPEPPKPASDGEGADCAPPSDDSALLKGRPKAVGPMPKTEPEPEPPPIPPETKATVEPAAASPVAIAGIPGLYELTVDTGMSEEPQVKYWVQVPPEYDPYRRYPCIVTLNGGATTPQQQIDWWAGSYNPAVQTRYGQATRHGYIVIAPRWTREHQRQYEFSSREHAAVLLPLRDACKRFSIDADRVFLTGHSMGGTAAWDVGLAHPDLWAGVMPIVAMPSGTPTDPTFKYISQYSENAKYVPLYFVCGEKDSSKWASAHDWDEYLTKIGYDAMVVEYLGRGHEAFFDEIQHLFDWMRLHKRDFFPKEFTVESLRPWDYFFWWVETANPRPISVILPAEWGDGPRPSKKPTPAETKVDPLAPNGVTVQSKSCGKVTVWLSPELVTFNDTLKVVINGNRYLKTQPNKETLLEDVRTRGDRQHPFWAKVEHGR
jgi:predicted esterase